jgi:hypothetical protein
LDAHVFALLGTPGSRYYREAFADAVKVRSLILFLVSLPGELRGRRSGEG